MVCITAADSLAWLQRYEELRLQEIIVLRQTYVGQIKAKDLLEISQEALQNYCYLLNLEKEPELSEAFVTELKRILRRKRRKLMTGLVEEMEKLLEKRYSALNSTTASETPPA